MRRVIITSIKLGTVSVTESRGNETRILQIGYKSVNNLFNQK